MWWDCLSRNVQCPSHAEVGHMESCDETAFHKICNVTHKLLVIGKNVMRLPHKMCAVTHRLLVIGKDVMRLPFTKPVMSLTSCWSSEKMWWDCFSPNVQYYSHKLLVIGKDGVSQNLYCHSLPVGQRKKNMMKLPFDKICNVTHTLLVIGKVVMRLPSIKIPITHKLLVIWKYVMRLNLQCHSHAVGHRKKCGENAFHQMYNATHKLLVIGKSVMRLPSTRCVMSLTPCWS
jgi:hypothetical protein